MSQGRSLRLRLLLGAAVLIVVAVAVTGAILSALFRDQVRSQYDTELLNHLNHLTALLELDGRGEVRLRELPSDPRFQAAYGGRYWQVEPAGQPTLRSRSLWDRALSLDEHAPPPGQVQQQVAELPGLGQLLVVERLVRFRDAPDKTIRMAVALPASEVAAVTSRFDHLLVLALSVLAAGLIAASMLQVTIGLMPLARLGRALAQVRSGAAARLRGNFPTEVRPLVEELNGLLEHQEQLVQRAQAQTGDLAHGLTTSLQLLLLEADRLQEDGPLPGQRIREPVLRMQRLIDHQLARARAESHAQARGRGVEVAHSVDALLRVLGPLAAERGIAIDVAVPRGPCFAGDAADLEEMLGNLLDNARKWARSRVRIALGIHGQRIAILVEDDGPGLAAARADALFQRGTRLDERVPGNGLGLAITRDLADIYGGKIQLGRSAWGGLAASLDLPKADAPAGSPSGM